MLFLQADLQSRFESTLKRPKLNICKTISTLMVILHLQKFPKIILRYLCWQEIGERYLELGPSVMDESGVFGVSACIGYLGTN